MPQVTTKHGTDDEGRTLYTRDEYNKLMEAEAKLNDAAFDDLTRANAEGRIVTAPNAQPDCKTWTRDEWEAASKRTGEMSASEFDAWESAPDDGRIE